MKSFFDECKHDSVSEERSLKGRVEQRDSWYVADQFKQLDKPGPRYIIEERWKRFGDILLHYLKNISFHGTIGQLRYLDAGCGDGINLQWASGFFKNNHIDVKLTGLDYNPLRVGRVVEKQLTGNTYIASLLYMPFGDSTFDIVLCNHVLEHIRSYPKALTEIGRVLKPGGLFIIGVPNEGCFLAKLRNRVIQRSILKNTDHINFFRLETLNEALRKAGFDIMRVYNEGFFLPHLWVHYLVAYFSLGRKLLSMLGKLFPGQSAGLTVYAVRPREPVAYNK